ncbi:host cell division inhibitor Icd-like protein [Scandinavium manionii]|uniref:host cell division inhibitor Icd-like protein n=2 Tax=Scandinavium manionii TaxID=2926520 RepID=UPI002165EFDB|nr:host cell division inhibitor Icd-like protein [Scandinavium manionii]MCS2166986.1 host cell division inhibitor Icd-like protein [Scandinavium manionii]
MLTTLPKLKDYSSAPAKSGVGIGLPDKAKGDNTRAAACFLLSNILHAFNGGLVAELRKKRRVPFAPVRPICCQFTTNRLVSICGDLQSLQKEIATMAVCVHARLKTFIFAAVERANLKSVRPVMLHITAATERDARQSASRQYVLSFAGVIQNGGIA